MLLFVLFVAGLAAANPIRMARTSFSEKRSSAQNDYLVPNLPGLLDNIAETDQPLMHAGYLLLYKENNTNYFFWKFSDKNKAPEAENRTIFWLNGGPGCSSMDGALMEAGPLRVNENQQVVYNTGSWHKKGDIVFVDQPAGTGFSYTDAYDTELYQVKYDFLKFLEKYFEVFPEQRSYEITLAGESYAGQYIPYIAAGILEHNRQAGEKYRMSRDTADLGVLKGNSMRDDRSSDDSLSDTPKQLQDIPAQYNLKGLVIGNGWISPNTQSLSYLPYAVQAGLISTDHPQWLKVLDQHMKCQDLVAGAKVTDTFGANRVVDKVCEGVLSVLLQVTQDYKASKDQQCYNMYDYTLKDSYPSCGMNWPPDLEYVYPFLRQDSVMELLHIDHPSKWHECSLKVSSMFRARNLKPSITLFDGILQEIPIVLFHGNRDIICNYIGAEDMIKKLEWGGSRGYSDDVVVYDWLYNDTVLGYIKSERNLTFVNVFDASHMVPFDKPETSRALMDILYGNVETRSEEGKKPKIITRPIGSSGVPVVETDFVVGSNSTNPDSSDPQSHTSRVVRLIQLAVIVVLVWGICALYNTYKSKPTSIIKTKPSGRKKNVQWADQLDESELHPESFILKALHKITGSEGYATVPNGDIEMGSVSGEQDDFIIASDDEEPARS